MSQSSAPVLLLSEHVAGRRYWRADEVWQYLRPGLPVVMTAEPDNANDPWAVALGVVVGETEYRIGYLPRGRNRVVAALLQQGWAETLTCCLTRVDPTAPLDRQLFVAVKVLPKVETPSLDLPADGDGTQ